MRTSDMPVGTDVRERLRAAQRVESEAITAVQKALAAEADARARLEGLILKHQAELAKNARAVQAAQAGVVRTSGLERAAALLDVSPTMLRSAVKESAQDTRGQTSRIHASGIQDANGQATSNKTPAATAAPTIAPTET
jgi:hypothetical protein